jgi:ribosomal protein S6--L-glutamate ligase
MRIAILTAILTEDEFRPYHYKLKEIAENRGHQLDLLKNGEFSIAYGNNKELIELNKEEFDISKYDVMLNRMSVRDAHTGNYYIIEAFNQASIPYFNNIYSVMRAKNKFHSLSLLHHKDIPIPKTVIIRRLEQIKDALDYIGRPPYIIKEIFGSGGSAVLLAESRRAVYPIFDFLWRKDRNAIFTIQELVVAKSQDFRDVRAIVLDNRVITAMERVPNEDEFRANLKQGGKAHYTELSEEERDYSIRATQSLKLDFAGVDFIRTEKGPFFLEVNSTPGFEGIRSVSEPRGIEVLSEIIKHCEKLAKNKPRRIFDV